jgi:protein-L-isoaspartate(D-aspartate) O-methyltransferase
LTADSIGIGMTSARTRERLIQRLRETGIRDDRVIEAMRAVPRHRFVEEALAHRAYEDTALPIGHGQTISQPAVVARMTEALLGSDLPEPAGPLTRVLEVGTGCGYQTAVLSKLCGQVYTVERVEPLFREARRRLRQLGALNVHFHLGDGSLGWPDHAPYDGILVAAAPADIPPALLAQLALGGRLVIPVGGPGGQELLRVTRTVDGYRRERLDRVLFVPLVSGQGETVSQ